MTPSTAHDRDVAAFDRRAPEYESGWHGRLHHEIARRAADLVLQVSPRPAVVLDVGCGTGYLLRRLAAGCPAAALLAGVDPAPAMVERARAVAGDDVRLQFVVGRAEQLPYPDGHVDLVVTTTSFDHWADQGAGLRECARVLRPGGHLVLADLCSGWLAPTLVFGRQGKARTRGRVNRLVSAAGFADLRWQRLYAVLINAVTAVRPPEPGPATGDHHEEGR